MYTTTKSRVNGIKFLKIEVLEDNKEAQRFYKKH